MRVVLDVNVLVSGYNFEGIQREIVRQWNALTFDLYVSDHIIEAFNDVLQRPYFARLVSDAHREEYLFRLRERAIPVDPVDDVHGIADDDEDDSILATAVAAGADFLVTGDKGLLALGEFRRIPIITSRAFPDMLLELP